MRTTTPARMRSGAITIDINSGRCPDFPADDRSTVLGHQINRTRARYLAQAEWIVAKDDRGPVGLVAYHRVASDVRLALEFLLDRVLPAPDTHDVTVLLLEAVERWANADGVGCLMLMLGPEVSVSPFHRRGYLTVACDSAGAWVQKALRSTPRTPTVLCRWH